MPLRLPSKFEILGVDRARGSAAQSQTQSLDAGPDRILGLSREG